MSIQKVATTYPIGTAVKYYPIKGVSSFKETVIRSEPWEVCGEPVIKVEGVAGCVCIDHLEKVEVNNGE